MRGGACVGDQDAAVRPGAPQQVVAQRRLSADIEHAQGEVTPVLAGKADSQHRRSQHAVGIHAGVDEAAAGRGLRQDGNGRADGRRIDQSIEHHGQHGVAVAPDAVGQDGVVARVDGVGFGKDQVQPDRTRALQAIQQRRVHGAAPRPASQRFDAGVVDGHDQDVRRHVASGQGDGPIIENLVDPPQAVERTQ